MVDLIDQALREAPIGMRVIKGTSEADDETVSYLRPSYHPDGVIKGETSLDQGLYTVIITAEGLPPLRYQYPLRVPDDQLCEHISHRGRAADRPAAVDLCCDTSS